MPRKKFTWSWTPLAFFVYRRPATNQFGDACFSVSHQGQQARHANISDQRRPTHGPSLKTLCREGDAERCTHLRFPPGGRRASISTHVNINNNNLRGGIYLFFIFCQRFVGVSCLVQYQFVALHVRSALVASPRPLQAAGGFVWSRCAAAAVATGRVPHAVLRPTGSPLTGTATGWPHLQFTTGTVRTAESSEPLPATNPSNAVRVRVDSAAQVSVVAESWRGCW